eukprot:3936293-Rhodomonas_salina.2
MPFDGENLWYDWEADTPLNDLRNNIWGGLYTHSDEQLMAAMFNAFAFDRGDMSPRNITLLPW